MVVPTDQVGLLAGAVVLGAIHGAEPGHGWPVAASYALDRANAWAAGLAASVLLGVGHLVSSVAVVGLFFYAKAYFSLTQVNDPIALDFFGTTVTVGGPVSVVAGVLLIALGVREYGHGHSHSHAGDDHRDSHDHGHDDHRHGAGYDESHVGNGTGGDGHGHTHDPSDGGFLGRVTGALPLVGARDGSHEGFDDAPDRSLFGIAWFAFLLGFAHEEEFEIIALCAGSTLCLELMLAYALTVILGIVGLTMLLIAGYRHSEERVERYAPYLPILSAVVLVGMGVGFVLGVF